MYIFARVDGAIRRYFSVPAASAPPIATYPPSSRASSRLPSAMGLCRCCELAQAPPDGLYCSRTCAGRAAGAAAKAKREGTAGTTHDLRRGEEVLVHFPGQTAAQLHAVTGDWWPAVVRDFRWHYPRTSCAPEG